MASAWSAAAELADKSPTGPQGLSAGRARCRPEYGRGREPAVSPTPKFEVDARGRRNCYLLRRGCKYVPTVQLEHELKANPIKPPHVVWHFQVTGRALAWSALLAITLLLVLLLQALAAAALVEEQPATLPPATTRF